MKRTKTSRAWMREHVTDFYVRRAKELGYRSRAAFKLLEIDERDKLLRPGLTVIDLGAAPGGWSQVAKDRVGPGGRVLALDVLPMNPIAGVEFVEGDFNSPEVVERLLAALNGRAIDLVISDMAPNISGLEGVDQARSLHLAELALDFASQHLKPGGSLLVKVFQGAGFDEFVRALRGQFGQMLTRKPAASRGRSSEVYLLGRAKSSSADRRR